MIPAPTPPSGESAPPSPEERDHDVTHELKVWPAYFDAILDGMKPFEVRKNDRGFRVGDYLHLREWSPGRERYTGRECWRRITYRLQGWDGLAEGVAVLGLTPPPDEPDVLTCLRAEVAESERQRRLWVDQHETDEQELVHLRAEVARLTAERDEATQAALDWCVGSLPARYNDLRDGTRAEILGFALYLYARALIGSVASEKARAEAAEARAARAEADVAEYHRQQQNRARLRGALRDLCASGVEMDDARLDYLTVQIDRSLWEQVRALTGGADHE